MPVIYPEGCGGLLSSMVTFVVSVWPETFQALDSPQTLIIYVFLGQSKTCFLPFNLQTLSFTKNFHVVTSDLYLAYFVPQRRCVMLCCE